MNNILSQNAFWVVNKDVAKDVGIEAALLLSDLITKEEYFEKNNMIDADDYFFNTSENIEEDIFLSYHKQKKAIQILKEKGYIDTQLKGTPAKLHFKIFKNKILNFLKTCFKDSQKLYNNNNKENKNKVKKSNIGPVKDESVKSNKSTKKVFTEESFQRFYKLYPPKKGNGAKGHSRRDALKVWLKLNNLPKKRQPTIQQIISSLKKHKTSTQWQDAFYQRNDATVPAPSTWLNQSRWEEAVEEINARWSTVLDIKQQERRKRGEENKTKYDRVFNSPRIRNRYDFSVLENIPHLIWRGVDYNERLKDTSKNLLATTAVMYHEGIKRPEQFVEPFCIDPSSEKERKVIADYLNNLIEKGVFDNVRRL